MKRVLAVHLLNDFSGSPLVLSTWVKSLLRANIPVTILTAAGHKGFLSDLRSDYEYVDYRFEASKGKRLLQLLKSQFAMFRKVWQLRRKTDVVYINTLLPFGAAFAGWLAGLRVIYHIHETSVKPAILKGFLKAIARLTADEVIYVSRYLAEKEGIKGLPSTTVYNALSGEFKEKSQLAYPEKEGPFTALMLCSLKKYKGPDTFLDLARKCPDQRFFLVINANWESINQYFRLEKLPDNLWIFPAQKDVHWFYRQANVVLNLSDPLAWTETFGMTLLEGMQYGLPVIAPPVGGPTEIVDDQQNGYLIHPEKTQEIAERLAHLTGDDSLYQRLSAKALKKAEQFSEEEMTTAISSVAFRSNFLIPEAGL